MLARVLFFLLLLVPGIAGAHASLIATVPEDGAVLEQSPTAVRLDFNEPVEPVSLRVVDASGRLVAGPAGSVVHNATISLPLDAGLPRGSYVVSWRVVSADSHPVSGAFAFGVGVAPAVADAAADEPAVWKPILAAMTALTLAGLALSAGGALFLVLVGPFPRPFRPVAGGALLAVAAFAGGTLATGALLAGQDLSQIDGNAWRLGFATTRGDALLALAAASLLLLAGAARNNRLLLAVGGVGAPFALALTGHVATAEPRWLTVPALLVHLAGMVFWLGALLPLFRLLRQADAVIAVRRFSSLALFVVPLLMGSGVVIAAVQLGGIDALADSFYGSILMVKVGAAMALLLLAAWNRESLTPALERDGAVGAVRLRRSIQAEAIWAVLLLAATAVLMQTPPPRATAGGHHDHAAHEPASGWSVVATEGTRSAVITLDGDAIRVQVLGADQAPLAVKQVVLVFARPDLGIEGLERPAAAAGPGLFEWRPAKLSPAGRWDLRVEALVTDFEKAEFEAVIDIFPTNEQRRVP